MPKIQQIETDKKIAQCCDKLKQEELRSGRLTFFRLVVAIFAMVAVVVKDALVVIVFAFVRTPVFIADLMMFVTVKSFVFQGETIARYQLSLAGHTSETLEVENSVLGAHHIVAFAEGAATLITFGPEQTNVILLAVSLAVSNEAGAVLVQKHLTLVTLKILI